MNLSPFIQLCHRRWNIPVLALLHRHRGCKFVFLAFQLGLSRDSLSRGLHHLIGLGLVRRNPGYGHPLRPEYLLTPGAAGLAGSLAPLWEWIRHEGGEEVLLKKWSLPVLAATGEGYPRFSALKQALPGISPRALTLALKELASAGWLVRGVTGGYPPNSFYRPSQLAGPMQPLLRAVIRSLPASVTSQDESNA